MNIIFKLSFYIKSYRLQQRTENDSFNLRFKNLVEKSTEIENDECIFQIKSTM